MMRIRMTMGMKMRVVMRSNHERDWSGTRSILSSFERLFCVFIEVVNLNVKPIYWKSYVLRQFRAILRSSHSFYGACSLACLGEPYPDAKQ
jgi:hypothetical protein